ncbi:MAG: hypothetical protein ACK55I_17325, partial [bacterium]
VDRRQAHARGPVGLDKLPHGAVPDERPARGIDQRRQSLRLAERVGEDHARPASVAVGPPPGVDLGTDQGRFLPAVDRQPERRLGDEHVARDRLEGRAGRVGLQFVVPGDDPGHAA